MSSFVYNRGLAQILQAVIDFDSSPLKVMLVTSAYAPDRSHDFVDEGGVADAVDAEIIATNYTRGWGGAGRKLASGIMITADDFGQRVIVVFPTLTWSTLGGTTDAVVAGAILVKEGTSDDTTSVLCVYWDTADQLTDGTDFKLTMDAINGNVQFLT